MTSPTTRRRRGQAMIEFCVAFPVILVVLFALFDVSRLMFIQISLDAGAQSGARLLGLNAPETRRGDVYRAIVKAAPGVAISPADFRYRRVTSPGGTPLVELEVWGRYQALSAFYLTRSNRLRIAATARCGFQKVPGREGGRLP